MRNERQAYFALVPKHNESDADKAQRIMQGKGSFAYRLAALNASGTDKGKVWS